MKKNYYLLFTILIASLSFGQIASDDFTYSDGSLVGNGAWVNHSGNAGDLLVSSGQVVVQHGTPSEDANLPFTPVSGVLYFGIDLSVSSSSDIPGSDNEYFAHFKDSGNGFRGRLDVVPGTGGGNYTLGISSSGSTADVVWGTDLTFGVTYRAIVKYDQDSGVATLWIDASSSSDTSITGDTPSSGTSIESFALRQSDSNNNETITVDNLIVGQTFAEVSGASTSTQVTIGTGTVENEELPIQPYFGYSYSQVIYTAAEIGVAGAINSVTYSANSATTLANSGDWVVYMGTTSSSSFSSTNDWVDVANMTQVFDGTVSPDGSGNVLVTLDTAFDYDGASNLVIAVDENTSGYDSTTHDFYCTGASETRGLVYYSDSTNPDPANPVTGQTRDYIANVVLDITESGASPASASWTVSVSGTDATVSVTVNNFTVAAAGGGDGHWHYTIDGGSTVMVYDTNDLVLTGLTDGEHTLVAWLVDDNHAALDPAVEQTTTFWTFSNDECSGAIAISDGEQISSDTTNATDSGDNSSNDLWYSYTGNGQTDDVTISLCGSSFDTYIRIFDACGGTQIAYNDDSCSTQSEVTFNSDGTTTYYIMVEGFSSSSGAFDLSASSTLGIDDVDLSDLKIYPNPVDGNYVTILSPVNGTKYIQVFDIMGRRVMDTSINGNTLDVSLINSGYYMIKVTIDGQSKISRLVVR